MRAGNWAIALSALFLVEVLDVGSDRVNFLETQNDIGHAGVWERRKTFMASAPRSNEGRVLHWK